MWRPQPPTLTTCRSLVGGGESSSCQARGTHTAKQVTTTAVKEEWGEAVSVSHDFQVVPLVEREREENCYV